MEIRECIVKIYDADGVEHSVKVRAESVYDAERLATRYNSSEPKVYRDRAA